MASEIQTPLTTERPHPSDGSYPREITERFQVGPSEAIHSDPRALDPLGQLADVDLILLGRVSLLRILLSVISVLSVVIRSSYLPESSPRLSAPARTCGRGRLARFSLPQRLAVWWVALPWPILPVPAVLLVLCRVVDQFPRAPHRTSTRQLTRWLINGRESGSIPGRDRQTHCPGQGFVAEALRDIVLNYVRRDRAEGLWQFGCDS